MSTAATAWIQRPAPLAAPRLRLFLLPHAGGGASFFRAWAKALPPHVEACAVQLPGRENRLMEPPFTRIEPLVEALADATAPLRDRPWAVLGHSNGALIAFEWARLLRARGEALPVHLFASGRRAPDVPLQRPPTANLPDDEFIADLRQLGGVPDAVLENQELLQIVLPLLRADVSLNEAYAFRPDAPLDVPITGLCGVQDEKATRDVMEPWERHTSRGFSLRLFPGDHFFLFGPGGAAVQEAVRDDLAAYL